MPTISYPSLKELRSLQDNGFLESDGLTINLGKEPLAISTLQVLISVRPKKEHFRKFLAAAQQRVENYFV
jgi:hypothetical protein